jgi:hypothetical protein
VRELRDDLTIGEILERYERFVLRRDAKHQLWEPLKMPESWYKPRVKKWVPIKARDVKEGDVMIVATVSAIVSDVTTAKRENRICIRAIGCAAWMTFHRDEFVTVEVEE